MVDIIKHGLTDENQKVKTITALSLAGVGGGSLAQDDDDDDLRPCFFSVYKLSLAVVG